MASIQTRPGVAVIHSVDSGGAQPEVEPPRPGPATSSGSTSIWSCLCCCFGGGGSSKPASKRPLLATSASARGGAKKKCLVLDLDETLVHSRFEQVQNADYVIPVELGGEIHHAYVTKRPGVDEFLKFAAQHFEIVVFTASLAKYADPLLDLLDPDKLIAARLFRESCVIYKKAYVKDLSLLGRPLSQTLIIDNSPASFCFHNDNAIRCQAFINDMSDRELFDLMDPLRQLAECADVRVLLRGWHRTGEFI